MPLRDAHTGQWKRLKTILCGILAASVLSGCTGSTEERPKMPKMGDITGAVTDLFSADPRSESDPTAEALYQDGIDYFDRERYARSISFFQKLRDDYPFSKEAEAAELKIAEAYYRNEDYIEADETYKNYLTFQPTGRHTHFVKYQLGRVNLDQFTGIDRDLEKVEAAKAYFESVIQDHPESEHVPDARKKLAETRAHLAEREIYVGNFYLKEENYLPARVRFENALRDYPGTPAAERAQTALAAIPANGAGNLPTPESSAVRTETPAREKTEAPPKPQFVTKEGYVHEDPDDKRWYSYLNPLSWDDDGEPEEERTAAPRQTAAGEGRVAAEEPTVAEKITGFFDSLNPFASSKDDRADEAKTTAPAETTAAKAVVEDIDKTLGTRGGSGSAAPTPPVTELPPDEKPSGPAPSDPATVLGDIDSKLGSGTKQGDTPTPPASDPALFTVREPKDTGEKSGPAGDQPELLEGIDKQLRREGIGKPPALPRPPASP